MCPWGSPGRILEWVAMPSSRGSSNPGINPTSLKSPALAGEFFTNSATWYKVHTDFTVILGFKVRTREHLTQPPWPTVSWAKCHHDNESEDYWEMPKLEDGYFFLSQWQNFFPTFVNQYCMAHHPVWVCIHTCMCKHTLLPKHHTLI